MKMYHLERIKDGRDWKRGMRVWATHRCTGWKVISIMEV